VKKTERMEVRTKKHKMELAVIEYATVSFFSENNLRTDIS